MGVYANFSPNEGTVTTTATVTFPWRARNVIITNDSDSRNLEFKFNTSESYGTLKPTETVNLYLHANEVLLRSPDSVAVAYRVWGHG